MEYLYLLYILDNSQRNLSFFVLILILILIYFFVLFPIFLESTFLLYFVAFYKLILISLSLFLVQVFLPPHFYLLPFSLILVLKDYSSLLNSSFILSKYYFFKFQFYFFQLRNKMPFSKNTNTRSSYINLPLQLKFSHTPHTKPRE